MEGLIGPEVGPEGLRLLFIGPAVEMQGVVGLVVDEFVVDSAPVSATAANEEREERTPPMEEAVELTQHQI